MHSTQMRWYNGTYTSLLLPWYLMMQEQLHMRPLFAAFCHSCWDRRQWETINQSRPSSGATTQISNFGQSLAHDPSMAAISPSAVHSNHSQCRFRVVKRKCFAHPQDCRPILGHEGARNVSIGDSWSADFNWILFVIKICVYLCTASHLDDIICSK